MAILDLPVGRQTPRHRSQNPTGQPRHFGPRHNEKSSIVSQVRQVAVALRESPPDELVAGLALPRRRTKHHACQQPALVVAHRVLQVLSHRSSKAQVVKLAQSGSHLLALGSILTDFGDVERSQLTEIGVDPALVPGHGRDFGLAHPVGRALAPFGQLDMTSLLELEQKRAAGHVLELAGAVAPVPVLAQQFGQPPAAPVRMVRDELPDQPQFRRAYLASLQGERRRHERHDAGRHKRSPAENEKNLPGPIPPRARDPFDSVDKGLELFRAQRVAGTFAGHPSERPSFESFVVEHEPRSVPKKDLQTVEAFIGEDEKMSAGRVLLEDFLHQNMKPVEALATVHGSHRDEHPCGRRETQHGRRS